MVAVVEQKPGQQQEVNQKTAENIELRGTSAPEAGDASSVFEARNRRALREVNKLMGEFRPDQNAETSVTPSGAEVTSVRGNNIHEIAAKSGQDVYERTRTRAQAMGVSSDAAIETAWVAKQIAEHSARAEGGSLEVKERQKADNAAQPDSQKDQQLEPEKQREGQGMTLKEKAALAHGQADMQREGQNLTLDEKTAIAQALRAEQETQGLQAGIDNRLGVPNERHQGVSLQERERQERLAAIVAIMRAQQQDLRQLEQAPLSLEAERQRRAQLN